MEESNEFFYFEKDESRNLVKSDAALHEDMLDNPSADLYCRLMSFHKTIIDHGEPVEVVFTGFTSYQNQYQLVKNQRSDNSCTT